MNAALLTGLTPPVLTPPVSWCWPEGRDTRLRLLAPGDTEAQRRFFNGLSLDSRHQRFHVGLRELSPSLLALLTEVDQQLHRAWIVEQVGTGMPTFIADARFVSDATDPGRAEFALAVADAWQGRGLGRRLLAHLQADARAHGVHALFGDVLAENRRMLALMREAGLRLQAHPEGEPLIRGIWTLSDSR